jgi:hypothetical protein
LSPQFKSKHQSRHCGLGGVGGGVFT